MLIGVYFNGEFGQCTVEFRDGFFRPWHLRPLLGVTQLVRAWGLHHLEASSLPWVIQSMCPARTVPQGTFPVASPCDFSQHGG